MTKNEIYCIRLVVANELGYENKYVKYASKYLRTGKAHPQNLLHINIESIFAVRWIEKNSLTIKARSLSQKYVQAIEKKNITPAKPQLDFSFNQHN